ncbi:TRAP transporter small permease [Chachezhania antarctica]|uniref:TRAP transporter small permease n=1 Tax=Chachezhania antarctica TaxID=2340860 RepID=UPI001F0988C9|nr:TRAP transporter small permease subunit [Chachezhania antarctica]
MTGLRAIAKGLDRLSAQLNRVGLAVAVVAVVVMLGSATWQVFARYLLAQPPIWTEELARFSMVWGGMMGASCAFRLKADPTLFPEALAWRGALGIGTTLVRSTGVLVFAISVLWFCLFGPNMNIARGYIARLYGRQSETMDVPVLVFGIAIPIALSFIIIHVAADIARALVASSEPETAAHAATEDTAA